jgi:hypothetical protein
VPLERYRHWNRLTSVAEGTIPSSADTSETPHTTRLSSPNARDVLEGRLTHLVLAAMDKMRTRGPHSAQRSVEA